MVMLGVLMSIGALLFSPSHHTAFGIGMREPIHSVALVDGKTGALLWYNVDHETPWTHPEWAPVVAERIFEDFPLGRRPVRSEYDWSGSPRLGVAPH